MSRHPFRKSFGLIVLYSIIIIGIFVLQFRNESVLSKNTGLLSISLAQTQNEDGTMSLKNSLAVNFKGISFSADEAYPAVLKYFGNPQSQNLSLTGYEQPTPLSHKFIFTEGVSITYSVSDTTSSASLSIAVSMPEGAESVSFNYKPASGFSVTEKSRTRLQLNSKNLAYVFTASMINDEQIAFTARNTTASYSIYDPTIAFSFASIDPDMIISQKATFDASIRNFKANLVSSVANGIKTSQTISEKTIVAYVAELASQGRFTEAVNYVPDSFKKGSRRTYLSAPYFNNLSTMYPSLSVHEETMANIVSNAIATKSLSVFTVENIADYINIIPSVQKIRELLSIPSEYLSNEDSHLTLEQATGILRAYLRLSELHSNHAELLAPFVEPCVEKIESCCNLNDSTLSLSDNDSPASPQLSLETGTALVQLGDFTSSEEYRRAGYSIINTVLAGTSLDSNAMGDAYPVLVSNINYPHMAVLHRTENRTIWAWTCATSVSYAMASDVATLSIKFSKGDSHYMMVNQVSPFYEIEIYNLSFHSDPRFETYNSSGFIYKENSRALFLKTRHKAETEIVRLNYKKVAPPPAPAAPKKPEAVQPAQVPAAAVPSETSVPEANTLAEPTDLQ